MIAVVRIDVGEENTEDIFAYISPVMMLFLEMDYYNAGQSVRLSYINK